MEEQFKWTELLEKYMRGTINDRERAELDRQLSLSQAKQQQFRNLTDPDLFQQHINLVAHLDVEAAWQKRMLPRIGPGLHLLARMGALFNKRALPKLAAAVIGLIAGVGILLYFITEDVNKLSISKTINIDLNSIHDGKIAAKDGTEIWKQKDTLTVVDRAASQNLPAIQENQLKVAGGKLLLVVLPDGTRVWVGSNSVLRFPDKFLNDKRAVSAEGDLYFEVAPDKSKPFWVQTANNNSIKVVGTKFKVTANKNKEETVSLIEGEVQLLPDKAPPVTLKQGQQALLSKKNKPLIKSIENIDITYVYTKQFYFDGLDIRNVLGQLAKHFDKKPAFIGKFSGSQATARFPPNETLVNILEFLKKRNNFEYRIKGDSLIFTGFAVQKIY